MDQAVPSGSEGWKTKSRSSLAVREELERAPNRGFVAGYFMQTEHLGPSFLAVNLARSIDLKGWDPEFTGIMEAYEYMAGMWLVGEDMPQETNCVTLHPTEKNHFGIPIPKAQIKWEAHQLNFDFSMVALGARTAL